MLRSIFSDWRKSQAHLLLLSKFRSPRRIDDFAKKEEWEEVLKEKPEKAIKRFVKEGYVNKGDLVFKISYKYKVNDLKKILEERGLKKSGRKDELINRLIESDPSGMSKLSKGIDIYICTDIGEKIVEDYLETENKKREVVEKQTIFELSKHNFRKSSKLIANYEAGQVFPRGIGMDWKNYDTKDDELFLIILFSRKPKILSDISDKELEPMRIGAGMFRLKWNRGQVNNWLSSLNLSKMAIEPEQISNLLYLHAHFLKELRECRELDIKHVEINSSNDPLVCSACKRIIGKKIRLDKVPELPYEKCTSESGCRCGISAIVI